MSPELLAGSSIGAVGALALTVWAVKRVSGRDFKWVEAIFEIAVGLIFGTLLALFMLGRNR